MGNTLVARVMVPKGEDHTPIYRQQKQIKRDCGMDVPLSSVDGWFARGCELIRRIYDRLDQMVKECEYLQMDESPVKVMPTPPNGKCFRGYMWSRYGPEVGIVVFHYDKRWSSAVAEKLIGPDYQGILQTDGHKAYVAVGECKTVIHAGCHGHARRGFEKSLGNDKERAKHVLKIYRELFAIEGEALKQSMTSIERLELGKEKSAPIMDKFKEWLDTEIASSQVLPKSKVRIRLCMGKEFYFVEFLDNFKMEV